MASTLPEWFTIESDTLISDSRLKEHQIRASGGYTNEQFAAEASRIFVEQGEWLLGRLARLAFKLRLVPTLDDQLTTLLSDRQKNILITATKEFMIANFYSRKTDEGSQGVAKAKADGRGEAIIGGVRPGSGESLIASLEDDLRLLAEVKAGNTGAAIAVDVERVDAYSSDSDDTEYFFRRNRC